MRAPLDPHRQQLLRHFKLDRRFVRGEGVWLWDDAGRRVLDMTSQYGALPLGHHPDGLWAAVEAVRRDAVPTMIQPATATLAEALASRLARIAPVDDGVTVFAQSGSEVVEIAVRLCREATGRPLIVAAEGGYHGHTLAARAMSWRWRETLDASTRPPGFVHTPYNDVEALEALFEGQGGRIAALVLEPVQGEGGVVEGSAAFMSAARALCTKYGARLVFDEVQTGLGRLGAMFGADLLGIRPDVVLLSKALGGGLVPLAACVASRRLVVSSFAAGHGATFANNNLTCAVGLALLDALEADDRGLIRRVEAMGRRFGAGLEAIARRFPGVMGEVRGRGGLFGLTFVSPGPEASFTMRHMGAVGAFVPMAASYLLNVHGVRVIPCLGHGGVLRLQPPLNIPDEAQEVALGAVEELVETISCGDWARFVRPVLGLPVAGRAVDQRHLLRPVQASSAVLSGESVTRFAFLLHPTCPEDLARTSPGLAELGEEGLRGLYAWLAARATHAPVCFMPSVRGAAGGVAQGWLVSLSQTPESMLFAGREVSSASIRAAVMDSVGMGAQVVGLGAFTSIVTGNGESVSDVPCALTTGSALTVASAVEATGEVCARMGRAPGLGLVLGLGAVGRAAAALLAEQVPAMVLVGNPARPGRELAKAAALMDGIYARALRQPEGASGVGAVLHGAVARWRGRDDLRALAHRLDAFAEGGEAAGLSALIERGFAGLGLGAPLCFTLDLNRALPSAEVIIAATSVAGPTIGPALLRPGAIICDVARPADVCRSVSEARPDVFVFDGGLVRYPAPISFGQNIGFPPGINLACLSETVLLALEGVQAGHFGVGRGDMVEQVLWIRAAARRQGFGVWAPSPPARVLSQRAEVGAARGGI